MAGSGKRSAAPSPAPSHAGLGRISDTATRELLRLHGDRLSAIEARLAALEATALQTGSPVDGYGQRITRVANPQQPFDAVNLQTLRREILRATISVSTPSTEGTPTPTTTGLTALGRGFALNGVRWDWRGMTAFPLFWRVLNNIAEVDTTLNFCAANRVTVPRVLLSFKSSFWTSRNIYIDPAEYADYWPRLEQFIGMCTDRGLTPELVIFGDCSEIYTSPGARVVFVQAMANWMRARNPNIFLQIANEPDQIGLTNQEALDLARAYTAIDPRRMLSPGPRHDVNGGSLFFNQAPATYLTFHAERRTSPTIWEWVALHYGYPPVTQTDRPPVSDEPINAGTGTLGGTDAGPDRWYCFGALSRLLKFSTTFHFEDGLWGFPPTVQAAASACFDAWKQGLDDISFDMDGTVFGRTAGGSIGDDPMTSVGGAYGYAGRHNGQQGQAIVLNAPGGWVPSPAAGWTAEVVYSLDNCRRVRVVRS